MSKCAVCDGKRGWTNRVGEWVECDWCEGEGEIQDETEEREEKDGCWLAVLALGLWLGVIPWVAISRLGSG